VFLDRVCFALAPEVGVAELYCATSGSVGQHLGGNHSIEVQGRGERFHIVRGDNLDAAATGQRTRSTMRDSLAIRE
jgi:hypothetical protein